MKNHILKFFSSLRKQTGLFSACTGVLLFFGTAAWLARTGTITGAEPPTKSRVQILTTADIHGAISKSKDTHTGVYTGGGLALARQIQQQKERFGTHKTLLIDTGDTCQGSVATAVSRGQAGIDLLNSMNVDVWIPGNHDFDFGTSRFHSLRRSFNGHTLAANLRYQTDGEWQEPAPWHMFRRGGVRIAVIGATSRDMEGEHWGNHIEGLQAESVLSSLQHVMPRVLRERPHVIVVALHDGWSYIPSKDGTKILQQIARKFPAVDLILGAHTHSEFPGRKLGEKTWYVQAGPYAETFGVIHITVDTGNGRIHNLTSKLIEVPAEGEAHDGAYNAVKPHLKRAEQAKNDTIGRITAPIKSEGTPGINCDATALILRAMAEEVQADVALHSSPPDVTLKAPTVTPVDLVYLLPYNNRIGVARLQRAELEAVLEEQYDHKDSHAYSGVYGIRVKFNTQGEVQELHWPDGEPLHQDGHVKAAFSSYTIAGANGRFKRLHRLLRRPDVQLTDTGTHTRQAVKNYLRAHSPLQIEAKQWIMSEHER